MVEKKLILADRTHPLFDDSLNKWNLLYSSVRGGTEFIEDNLWSHRLEDTDDYEERLDRGFFLNFCDAIPTIYNSYIFKKRIERPPDSTLQDFRKNVDGRGTDVSEFVKRVGYFSSVFGVMHVLVDIPSSEKTKVSKADQRESELIPYCSMIYPTQLRDWSLDSSGNFNWVIIESTYYQDLDPEAERAEEKHYKLITKEDWRIEDEDGNPPKFEDGAPSNGPNSLGFIPIATMYHKYVAEDKIGESMLKDIVYVNRTILNWCSCIDEQIERQTFSQLTVPDAGDLSDEEGKGGDPLTKIGTSSIWTFNAESKHPPKFISPDVENLQTIWKLVIDHIKEIYRMAGLIGSSDDMYVSKSGRAAQMGFMGVNSALSEKAGKYEKFENDISHLAYWQLGEQIEDYKGVKYPDSFDITALLDEIESSFKIMERNMSPTLNKTIMVNIARRAVPQAPEEIRELIEKEIESGDGIVLPIKSVEASSEEDGSGNPNSNLGKTFKGKNELEEEETKHRKKEK
jgi:hypothetical protein